MSKVVGEMCAFCGEAIRTEDLYRMERYGEPHCTQEETNS